MSFREPFLCAPRGWASAWLVASRGTAKPVRPGHLATLVPLAAMCSGRSHVASVAAIARMCAVGTRWASEALARMRRVRTSQARAEHEEQRIADRFRGDPLVDERDRVLAALRPIEVVQRKAPFGARNLPSCYRFAPPAKGEDAVYVSRRLLGDRRLLEATTPHQRGIVFAIVCEIGEGQTRSFHLRSWAKRVGVPYETARKSLAIARRLGAVRWDLSEHRLTVVRPEAWEAEVREAPPELAPAAREMPEVRAVKAWVRANRDRLAPPVGRAYGTCVRGWAGRWSRDGRVLRLRGRVLRAILLRAGLEPGGFGGGLGASIRRLKHAAVVVQRGYETTLCGTPARLWGLRAEVL